MHGFCTFIVAISLGTTGAIAAEIGQWGPWTVSKDSPLVAAGFKHDDGGALVVLCDTKTKLISLLVEEPRANWQPGEQLNFMTRIDTAPAPGPSKAFVIGPKRYVVKEEATLDLVAMGQATSYFAVGTGDYARIFPTANFRKAVEPVLIACGDHW